MSPTCSSLWQSRVREDSDLYVSNTNLGSSERGRLQEGYLSRVQSSFGSRESDNSFTESNPRARQVAFWSDRDLRNQRPLKGLSGLKTARDGQGQFVKGAAIGIDHRLSQALVERYAASQNLFHLVGEALASR